MENKSKKFISICIAFFMCCFLVCGNNVLASNEKQPNYDEISRQIAKDVERYHIPGMAVIVVNADNILFQETYGNCDSIDTPFLIGSMSKSFTALAVMQLVEDGKIDLNSSISEYIDASKWFADSTDCNKITIRNLLNQTSGITTYQTFGELKSTDSYGSHVYANVNYGLLGLIVEAVSGISYDEYMTNNIFTPLGMEHSAAALKKSKENGLIDGYRNYFGIPIAGEPDYPEEIKNGTWTNIPAGYISSSISDIGRYLQMYLNDGENIISKESINSMFYDNVSVNDGLYYYGMGWQYSTEMFSQPMLWHAGLVENYTSNMFILPEQGIAVAVLANMNDYLVCNNLIGNIINPLIGEERQNLPNLYIILHLLIDVICFFLCFISIYAIAAITKWNKKEKKPKTYIIDSMCHIVIPIILLCIPLIAGIPFKVIWLFVKDLCLVLYINAGILITIGIYKLFF
ncbi:MAG: beta-lactamase family protein [Clostridium sp.]|nr:beta-lactamase family protein [Clostridium sp.]